MVVAAYGLILPQEVLDIAPLGCINIHASLLPRWRGAAPIHRAIEAGDAETGITLMQMDVGLDTGAMISEARTPISADDTTATLHDRLAQDGAKLIVEALLELERNGKLASTPQPADGVTYAEKIGKHEAALDWRKPAEVLARQVRAFDPFPGGVATLEDGSVDQDLGGGRRSRPHGNAGARHDCRSRRRRCRSRLRRRRIASHAIAETRRQALAGARIPRRLNVGRGTAFSTSRDKLTDLRGPEHRPFGRCSMRPPHEPAAR